MAANTSVATCSAVHAALARTYLDWHAQRAAVVQSCLAATGTSSAVDEADGHSGRRARTAGGAECRAWGAPFALRSASAALSAMRSEPRVARLLDQIALALLAAPSAPGQLSPRAERLIESVELVALLRACLRHAHTRASLRPSVDQTKSANGNFKKRTAASNHHRALYTPLSRMMSKQRKYFSNSLSTTSLSGRRSLAGGHDLPLAPVTRLMLPGGGRMPLFGLGTNFADCCCGGREWLGTEVLWGGSVRARLSPENSPACTQLPKAALYSRALRGGVRMIETGANYGTEVAVGEGIRDSGVARNEIFVISKAWPADRLRSPHTRALIGTAAVALQSRLKSMGLQSLDLYLAGDASVDISERGDSHQIPVHQPLLPEGAMHEAPRDVWDAMAPLTAEEWAASVGSAKTLGLAAAVGTGGELVEGSEVAQVHMSPCAIGAPFASKAGAVPLSALVKAGVVLLATQPAGDTCTQDAVVQALAAEKNVSPQQILSRWSAQLGIPLIVHTTNITEIRNAADIFEFELTSSEMEMLESVALLYAGDCNPLATRGADAFHLRPTWPCISAAPAPPPPPTPLGRTLALLLGPPPPGVQSGMLALLAIFLGSICSAYASPDVLGTVICGITSGALARFLSILGSAWLLSEDFYLLDADVSWFGEL